jgi:hypothetical protein
MAKLYLLAFAGLLLAAQLASAAEPSAADPAHKHPKPPSNSTSDGKPTKPPGNHTDMTKPGKPSWNHTAPSKPNKPGSNHTNWPKASDPKSKNITNTPWSKPFKPVKGPKWNKTGSNRWNKTGSGKWNKSSNANHTGAGGVKTAGRHGNKGGYGGKLLGGRKNFFLDPYTPMFTKASVTQWLCLCVAGRFVAAQQQMTCSCFNLPPSSIGKQYIFLLPQGDVRCCWQTDVQYLVPS